LSSGGFKLVRDEWNLAREALRRELAIIGLPTEGAESIFRALSSMTGVAGRPDFLTARRSEILEAASDLRPDGVSSPQQDRYPDLLDTANALAKFGVEPVPWISDPDDVSSGPMLGLSPRSVLVEELRRFAFAMEWLSTATLTRASTLAPGETMLTLIHDGFSRALSEWATKTEAGPARALAMLTAAEGERFNWRRPDAGTWGAFNGEGRIKRIINVRWRNCRITASLRRVVFVNCDLRGSRFVGCQFEGVVFVNCLLDNTTFSRCTITGTVSDPPPIDRVPADGDRQLPSFVVTADRDSVFALNRHRETVVSAAVLFSVTSGVAAVPWSGPTDGRLPYEDQLGGLTMYGGRLSSLMIQDCTFVDHGALSLRHIAGSSLDIVEQSHGTFEIFDSTIRGLSITKPVGDVGDSNSIVTIAINGCALADTWFGDGLRGRATIRGSVLWQLLSAGDPETFAVDVADCGYHGLVNVSSVAESSRSLPGFSLAAIVDRHDLVASATRMAYRARPAQLELERRAAAL